MLGAVERLLMSVVLTLSCRAAMLGSEAGDVLGQINLAIERALVLVGGQAGGVLR